VIGAQQLRAETEGLGSLGASATRRELAGGRYDRCMTREIGSSAALMRHEGKSPRAVHHFGPDPASVGGMGSVLRVIADHRIGSDVVRLHPTCRTNSYLWAVQPTARAMRVVMRMSSPDLVHVHLSERGSFVREGALLMLARQRGLPTVVTIHGASFLPFARSRPRLAAGVLRHADLITCLDPDVAEMARTMARDARVEVVPNPVPLYSAIAPADQTAEVVLFAGEIGPRKGADVLCRAWEMVARERTEARCILAGPRTDLDTPDLERLDIRPPVGPEEMLELLASARVVALPSRAEGMPMTLTEAMSAGRPFVSTPVGGIPALAAGGGGKLVPVGDADALAQRLIEFLAEPALARRYGEMGRGFCADTRSVEIIDARLRELYSSVL
jgi:glycosyltransferase involved in cell wall biosynthesis